MNADMRDMRDMTNQKSLMTFVT